MSARRKVEGAGGWEKWNGEQSKQRDLLGQPINHFRPPTSPLLLPPPPLFSFNFIFLLSPRLCLLYALYPLTSLTTPESTVWRSRGQRRARSHNLLCPLVLSCSALIIHLHLVLHLKLCPSSLPLPHGKKYPEYVKNTGQMCVGVCEFFRKFGQIVCTHTHIVVSEWELPLHVLDQLN